MWGEPNLNDNQLVYEYLWSNLPWSIDKEKKNEMDNFIYNISLSQADQLLLNAFLFILSYTLNWKS